MPLNITAPPQKRAVRYSGLKGIDFSKDSIMCDKEHSPNCLNMISDKSGLPEKRVGTRTLYSLSAPVNGIFYGDIEGEKAFLAHGGDTLYKFDDKSFSVVYSGMKNCRSTSFFMQHEGKSKLFLMTGQEFLCYDGKVVKNITEIAYTPTILIGRTPKGGGTPLEGVNLLSKKRREKFAGDGSDKAFQLSSSEIDAATVKITRIASGLEVELTEDVDFKVNRTIGQVMFTTAPPVPSVAGEDNIYITYEKTVEGYQNRVIGCNLCTLYGLGGSNRIFVTGNKDYKAYDRWCEINDPTYFPDINYSVVGSDNTKIMGYAKVGEYLAIIKEGNGQDSTIFIRSSELLDGKAAFPLKQGVTGVGAISPYSFASLVDEPLFLSRTGVYAITSNMVTAERTLQNRSFFADNKLCKEKGLETAVGTEWNGYYLLAINKRVYLFDSRRKSATSSGGFCYECYLWDNIPAVCFLSIEGELFFGTDDGRLCRFNTDMDNADRFNDDYKPIVAFYETAADNNQMPDRLKTLEKKGCTLTIKPSVLTGADVYVSCDGEPYELLSSTMYSLFSWASLDFVLFTFIASDTPKVNLIKKKLKRYTTIQFKLENSKRSQSFGVYELTYNYTIGNQKK